MNVDEVLDRKLDWVRVETTNLDGVFTGKVMSPYKFAARAHKDFAIPDLALGLDLGNSPQMGWQWPAWRGELPDVALRADLDTLVEWTDGTASVIADYWTADGNPLPACPRNALKSVVAEYESRGLAIKACVEIEATVFEESIEEARLKNYQDLTPLGGRAGAALVLAKSKSFVDYMREVARRLTRVGIPWEAWADEAAQGQIEFNIVPTDPVTASDHWARTKQIMREVAFDQGRSVTFMAKWSEEYGQGAHLNVSVSRDGVNLFHDPAAPDRPSAGMLDFLGGAIRTLPASSSFGLPTPTSYRRLVEFEGPPTTLTWGIGNKSCAIRAVLDGPVASRLEYRLPAADANMYLSLAAFLAGGLVGLVDRIDPGPSFDKMAWSMPEGSAAKMPTSLYTAIEALTVDTELRRFLGDELIDYWIGTRRWEWLCYHLGVETSDGSLSQWEFDRYFELV